tara:strand:- start:907 stop:1650 length:744 start_codon:yes stop_codon:yes gene_type:complete
MVNKKTFKPKLLEAKVTKRVDVTEDLLIIWITKPDEYSFKPGQYCTIGIDGLERAYSIVSAPHENELELFVELVPPPDGMLTPEIWKLKEGQTISIRPRAKGIFVFKPKYKKHLFVATVTGVVPYISILRDYLHNNQEGHEFYLLFGASYQTEFTYKDEIEEISKTHNEFVKFVPTVSRPKETANSSWTGETGRVNEIVGKYIEKYNLDTENTLIYACGHPGMIEDVKEKWVPNGFKVEEERFWKED